MTDVTKQKEKNSELQGLKELTKQRRRKTSEGTDRKNGLNNEKKRQRKLKTERIDQRTVRNDSGSQTERID